MGPANSSETDSGKASLLVRKLNRLYFDSNVTSYLTQLVLPTYCNLFAATLTHEVGRVKTT